MVRLGALALILGLGAGRGSGSALAGDLLPAVVISEIHYHPAPADGRPTEFLELFNPTGSAVAIGGWRLTGGVEFVFPRGVSVPAQGRVVVARDRAALRARYALAAQAVWGEYDGFLSDGGDDVFLLDSGGAYVDAVRYDDDPPWPRLADGEGRSLQRLCPRASSAEWTNWEAALPTPLAGESSDGCPPPSAPRSSVVINEIDYHPRAAEPGGGSPISSGGDDGEALEFVELFNPGPEDVDLEGWAFTDGIEFSFPAETVLRSGEFLVVCRDESAVRRHYGIANTIGDFARRLANEGERLSLSDREGRIVDSVNYRTRDPWPTASADDGRSLERRSAELPGDDPRNWAASSLPRSVFHHLQSEGPAGPGFSKQLQLLLDGPGAILVDNVSLRSAGEPATEFVPNGSFDAGSEGWVFRGNLASSGWDPSGGVDGGGALRIESRDRCGEAGCGARDSASFALTLPAGADRRYRLSLDVAVVRGPFEFAAHLSGGFGVAGSQLNTETPGARNSAAAEQLPPLVEFVGRSPRQPISSSPTRITALVRSSQPATVDLVYDTGGGPSLEPLSDDGLHGDRSAGDGIFGGDLPPFPDGTVVRYRVVARAAAGLGESPRPLEPEEPRPHEWWGYYVNDTASAFSVPVYTILVPGIDGSDPAAVNAAFDCRLPRRVSFAYDGELFPDVKVRFRGNTSCRWPKRNFKVTFHESRLFRRRKKINLNAMWSDKSLMRERLAWDFLGESGMPVTPTRHIELRINDHYHGLYLEIDQRDTRYLERTGLDPNANLYKVDFQDPVALHSRSEYAGVWEKETNERGSYDDIADFVEALHADATSPGGPTLAFWQRRALADLVIGYQAGQVILNNMDTLDINYFLYHDLEADRWGILPWDLDQTFGKFIGGGAGPLNDRMASDVGRDLGPWSMTSLGGDTQWNNFQDAFFRAGGGHFRRAYLVRLWDILERKLRPERLRATVSSWRELLAPEAARDREFWGRYPTNVAGTPDDMASNVEILLEQARLHRKFLQDAIRTREPAISTHARLLITELMPQPEAGLSGLEFVELLNTSGRDIEVSDWTIEGIGFRFPPGARVPRDGIVLVARAPDALRARYELPEGVGVYGPYSGSLDDGGETLVLRDAGPGYPATIDRLAYDDEDGWPPISAGHSLQLRRPGPDADNDRGEDWRSSSLFGGSPGVVTPGFVRGDVNGDGRANLSDPVRILGYLFLGQPSPVCLDSADADDSGRVNLTDAIYILTYLFRAGPPPPPPFPNVGSDPTPDRVGCRG